MTKTKSKARNMLEHVYHNPGLASDPYYRKQIAALLDNDEGHDPDPAIEAEVMAAYADCHGDRPFEETSKERNLNFRASKAVSRSEAIAIMRKAVPTGYNEFHADLLELLPVTSKVTIAREASVCAYVTPRIKQIPDMMADEWHQEGDSTRIWWD